MHGRGWHFTVCDGDITKENFEHVRFARKIPASLALSVFDRSGKKFVCCTGADVRGCRTVIEDAQSVELSRLPA